MVPTWASSSVTGPADAPTTQVSSRPALHLGGPGSFLPVDRIEDSGQATSCDPLPERHDEGIPRETPCLAAPERSVFHETRHDSRSCPPRPHQQPGPCSLPPRTRRICAGAGARPAGRRRSRGRSSIRTGRRRHGWRGPSLRTDGRRHERGRSRPVDALRWFARRSFDAQRSPERADLLACLASQRSHRHAVLASERSDLNAVLASQRPDLHAFRASERARRRSCGSPVGAHGDAFLAWSCAGRLPRSTAFGTVRSLRTVRAQLCTLRPLRLAAPRASRPRLLARGQALDRARVTVERRRAAIASAGPPLRHRLLLAAPARPHLERSGAGEGQQRLRRRHASNAFRRDRRRFAALSCSLAHGPRHHHRTRKLALRRVRHPHSRVQGLRRRDSPHQVHQRHALVAGCQGWRRGRCARSRSHRR